MKVMPHLKSGRNRNEFRKMFLMLQFIGTTSRSLRSNGTCHLGSGTSANVKNLNSELFRAGVPCSVGTPYVQYLFDVRSRDWERNAELPSSFCEQMEALQVVANDNQSLKELFILHN